MLNEVFFYAFGSVMFASFISLVGIFTISMKEENLTKILLYLVAFSTGALLGGAFFHLLPECFEKIGFGLNVSISILFGIVVFFVLEKMIHWRHCHIPTSEKHPHPFAYMNLIGDGIHNFIDGLIIGGAYIVNFELGIITTFAVILHEIPQEIGDFGVLIYGGFTKRRALFMNFLTALTSVFGMLVAFVIGMLTEKIAFLLVPFAAGGFIYIASTDLMPELHRGCFESKKSFVQLLMLILGAIVILALKVLIE